MPHPLHPPRRLIALLITAVIALAFIATGTGCGTTSSDRISAARSVVVELNERVEGVDEAIDRLEADIPKAQDLLDQAPSSVADKLRPLLDQATARLADLRELQPQLVQQLAAAEADLEEAVQLGDDANMWDEVALGAKATQRGAAFIPSPIGEAVAIGSGLIATFATWWGTRQRRRRLDAQTSLEETVHGLDSAFGQLDETSIVSLIKDRLSVNQSPQTKAVIRSVKAAA